MTHRITSVPSIGSGNNGISRSAVRAPARPDATKRIRVLLADDHPVVRKGILAGLEKCTHLEIVGEAADGEEALQRARELSPDVLLADIEMPHLTGLALAAKLREELPKVKVLVLSVLTAQDDMLFVVKSGARGYIQKEAALDEFIKGIETVNAGQTFFSPSVTRLALNELVRSKDAPSTPLTTRELEVLKDIAEGLSNKEIACHLSVGTRTVETHRERMMRKLNIHSIAGLTRYAIAKGVIALPESA